MERVINWRDLEVHIEDPDLTYLGHLGEILEDAPANLDSCTLDAQGGIEGRRWPGYVVAAPDGEPGGVDWTGFAAALAAARGEAV